MAVAVMSKEIAFVFLKKWRLANFKHATVVVNSHWEAAKEVEADESCDAPEIFKARNLDLHSSQGLAADPQLGNHQFGVLLRLQPRFDGNVFWNLIQESSEEKKLVAHFGPRSTRVNHSFEERGDSAFVANLPVNVNVMEGRRG